MSCHSRPCSACSAFIFYLVLHQRLTFLLHGANCMLHVLSRCVRSVQDGRTDYRGTDTTRIDSTQLPGFTSRVTRRHCPQSVTHVADAHVTPIGNDSYIKQDSAERWADARDFPFISWGFLWTRPGRDREDLLPQARWPPGFTLKKAANPRGFHMLLRPAQ
jgi:hypothetical protein